MTSRTFRLILLCGLVGCVLMGGSDWLMIWGDIRFSGALSWLTEGVAALPAWRTTAALALAFPAVLCYAPALFVLGRTLHSDAHRRTYTFLTALGLTPWLCLHLFYVLILALFGFLHRAGETGTAFAACEALFAQFSWVVMVAEVLMVLPFLYFLVRTVRGDTVYPRWMALNTPLLWLVVLKAATLLMPPVPFRLAFTNGLMNEAMFLWFLLFILTPLPRLK